MQVRAEAPRFYRPELDGLRFFAFLAVFWAHAAPAQLEPWAKLLGRGGGALLAATVKAGVWGLDLFFVLSSYLITELLLRERDRRGRIDVKAFWIRRILRIWPLYFAVLLLALAADPWLFPGALGRGRFYVAYLFFSANWVLAAWGPTATLLLPLWSVAIEEQFYFLWPLVTHRLTARGLGRLAVALVVVAFAARVVLCRRGAESVASVWYLTFTRFDPIALGGLVAVVLRARPLSLGLSAARALLGGSALAVVGLAAFEDALRATPVGTSFHYLACGLACTGMLVGTVAFTPAGAPRPRLLTTRPLVYLGRISYGLYVFHWVALTGFDRAREALGGRGPLVLAGRPIAGLLVTLALAAASYRWLEEPFLRLKERFAVVRSAPLRAER